MTSTSTAVDRLEDRYRIRFAGHPRVSRDPEELEKIISDLDQLRSDADTEEKARIENLSDLYKKEIAAIQAAINIPFAVPAARFRMWADLTMSRYGRKFAGQDRRTRDVALLDELIADLQGIRNEMARVHAIAPQQRLDEGMAVVDRALGTYRTEAEAIRTHRRTGTLAEQGSRFANLANAQFETYLIGFAKQTRLSRHPETLDRIIAALDEIRRGMQSLKIAGWADRSNDSNIAIVEDRIRQYREENATIRSVQAEATLEQRVGSLGQAANEVFAMYREQFSGKSRAEADPAKVDELFERLWPTAREMDALDSEHDDDTNGRNLRLVTDNLLLYGREYEAIRKAKKG